MTNLKVFIILNAFGLALIMGAVLCLVPMFYCLHKKKRNGAIIFGLICSAAFIIGVFAMNNQQNAKDFRNEYPLDVSVQVEVNREEMNSHYDKLSETEIQVFELSKESDIVFITRTTNNKLMVKVGETDVTLYEPNNGKTSDEWVFMVNKGYYTPLKSEDTSEEVNP